MEIYIITTGSYSDYSINAVYLDKELAEAHMALREKAAGGFHDAQLEVWPVGEALPVIMHSVLLTYPTVQISKRHSVPDYSQPPVVVPGHGPSLYTSDNLPKTHVRVQRSMDNKSSGYSGTGYGRTPEAAEKSLWDALAALKAEEAGL